MTSQSIYGRIGGREAVEAVVTDFYDRVFDDDSLAPYFEDVDRQTLYSHQVQFISTVTGGPVDYDGAGMREAHAHLDITDEAFDTVAAHLDAVLRENGVGEPDVEAILDAVEELREPVVSG